MNLSKSQFNLKALKNKRGITLVILAIMLVVLIALAALAIDIAYMYVVKNELQVAADAAALAGTALLTGTIDNSTAALAQEAARQEAWRFACRNKAAGSNVYLQTNTPADCNTPNPPSSANLNGVDNAATGDIIVGHWRSAAPGNTACATGWETLGNGYFCPANGTTGLVINAIKTVPRRTSAGQTYGMGPVSLFLGRVIGWNVMSVKAEAIAARLPRAINPLSICIDSCNLSLPKKLFFKEQQIPAGGQGVAWTEFSTTKSVNFGPDSNIAKYIRGELIAPNVCCNKITTNNAAPDQIMDVLKNEFERQKALTGQNYWEVITPVFGTSPSSVCPTQIQKPPVCPPGNQPDEPLLVTKYAIVRIIAVDGNPSPGIIIDYIRCIDCPASELFNQRTALVK